MDINGIYNCGYEEGYGVTPENRHLAGLQAIAITVRDNTLEDAAKVCDRLDVGNPVKSINIGQVIAACILAEAIRALKSTDTKS